MYGPLPGCQRCTGAANPVCPPHVVLHAAPPSLQTAAPLLQALLASSTQALAMGAPIPEAQNPYAGQQPAPTGHLGPQPQQALNFGAQPGAGFGPQSQGHSRITFGQAEQMGHQAAPSPSGQAWGSQQQSAPQGNPFGQQQHLQAFGQLPNTFPATPSSFMTPAQQRPVFGGGVAAALQSPAPGPSAVTSGRHKIVFGQGQQQHRGEDSFPAIEEPCIASSSAKSGRLNFGMSEAASSYHRTEAADGCSAFRAVLCIILFVYSSPQKLMLCCQAHTELCYSWLQMKTLVGSSWPLAMASAGSNSRLLQAPLAPNSLPASSLLHLCSSGKAHKRHMHSSSLRKGQPAASSRRPAAQVPRLQDCASRIHGQLPILSTKRSLRCLPRQKFAFEHLVAPSHGALPIVPSRGHHPQTET